MAGEVITVKMACCAVEARLAPTRRLILKSAHRSVALSVARAFGAVARANHYNAVAALEILPRGLFEVTR